ncbi:hypothetical protein RZA67_09970 [Stenotrophomonas sp. C3(2023)]|uniref:hypothetical protein n=1 Tax=Stenotrophomonas sp. C3(2023) TaxID=3080277 RepID=UPI00293D17C5|nr:hypothetical protein [Stenotrophomonas sp. C3(2023)]MDV3469055.1 hypothetical protein [Stenotrophomonas sp. C3(2023)]
MNQHTSMAVTVAADLIQQIATKLFGDAGAGINDLVTLANRVQADVGNPVSPSPGGQGGLNYERMFVDACAALAEVSRELGCDPEQGGAEPILAAIAELREALAARQPVGQEPITVEAVATVRRDGEGDYYIDWLTEGAIADLEAGDVLMVSDRSITDDSGSGEVYASPPAQAVDLGQFKALAALAHAVIHHGDQSPMKNGVFAEAERLLALIDGKAVQP